MVPKVIINYQSNNLRYTLEELTNYLALPTSYENMNESQKTDWLINELNTKRPLIPSSTDWSQSTDETFSVLLVEYLKDVLREALIDFKESDLKKDL